MDENQHDDNHDNQQQEHHEEQAAIEAPQVADAASDELDAVKRRALEALAPLLASLDLDPERKFDICMSAIRFTDNKALTSVALEAALAIEDSGTKAEALVELVNEVNYLQQPTA